MRDDRAGLHRVLYLKKRRRKVRAVNGNVARSCSSVTRQRDVVEGRRLRPQRRRRKRRVALQAELEDVGAGRAASDSTSRAADGRSCSHRRARRGGARIRTGRAFRRGSRGTASRRPESSSGCPCPAVRADRGTTCSPAAAPEAVRERLVLERGRLHRMTGLAERDRRFREQVRALRSGAVDRVAGGAPNSLGVRVYAAAEPGVIAARKVAAQTGVGIRPGVETANERLVSARFDVLGTVAVAALAERVGRTGRRAPPLRHAAVRVRREHLRLIFVAVAAERRCFGLGCPGRRGGWTGSRSGGRSGILGSRDSRRQRGKSNRDEENGQAPRPAKRAGEELSLVPALSVHGPCRRRTRRSDRGRTRRPPRRAPC